MNRDDEFIAQVEDYLETFEGVVPLPDRVRDAVRADLPRTRQVRPGRAPERILDMISRSSPAARWGAVAAIVAAAVALGAVFAGNARNMPAVGAAPGGPAATPVASPSATAGADGLALLNTANHVPCTPDATDPMCIEPGTYRLSIDAWPSQVAVDVPAGWFEWLAGSDFDGLLVDGGLDAPDGSGWGVVFTTVRNVWKDPCDESKGTLDAAETATVDGLVAAIQAWPGFRVTAPEAIDVDGLPGQVVEVSFTGDLAGCPNPVIWTTSLGMLVDGYPMAATGADGHAGTFRIVDVGGTLLVIRTTDFPQTSPHEAAQGVAPDPDRHAADQVELQQILDSITIGPPQP